MIRLHPISIIANGENKFLFTFKDKEGKNVEINFTMDDEDPYAIVDYDKEYRWLTHDDPARDVITICISNFAEARDRKIDLSEDLQNLIPLSISLNDRIDEQNFSYKVSFENNGRKVEEILYLTYCPDDKRLNIKWNHGNHVALFSKRAHLLISESETLAPNLLQAVVSFDQSRYFITKKGMKSLRFEECQ